MHLEEFLVAAVLLLAVTAVAVAISRRIGLGSILGFLVAGLILGPSGFAITGNVNELLHFTELGVVFLLFIIGLEMRPRKLWSMRRLVFGLGTMQVLVTGAVLAAYAWLIGMPPETALILGLGLALSSTAFVLQLLGETGETGTPAGNAAFSVLLLQDIAIVPMLMLVPILAEADMPGTGGVFWLETLLVVGAVAAVLVIGRYGVPLALKHVATARNREAFTMISVLAALGAALAMEAIGASMALGAFLMGMMLSVSNFRHQIEAEVDTFKSFLLGLFFISVGMSINLDVVMDQGVSLAVTLVGLLVLKGLVLVGLGLAFGLGRPLAIRLAFLLPQSGEFGFVLFGAAIGAGLLQPSEFALVAVTISVSMAATPVLNKLGIKLAAKLQGDDGTGGTTAPEAKPDDVVVAGYGRAGQTVCAMLHDAGVPYIAFDAKPSMVSLGKTMGHNVHYGNLHDPSTMQVAGVASARAVVVTLDNMHTAQRIVSEVKNFAIGTPIYARAESLRDLRKLLETGASKVTPALAESGLALGSSVLTSLGMAEDDVETIADGLRRNNYAHLDTPR